MVLRLEGDLANIAYFHERGIRYITLTHAKDNAICDSSYDTTGTHQGLSDFGRDVVAEMNRVGVMVDISHVSDNAFYHVMDVTKVPAIASHSSCRHFTPGFERNMNDDMIKRLAENGGVIQINFGSTFLTKESQDKREANRARVSAYAEENNLEDDDEKVEAFPNPCSTTLAPLSSIFKIFAASLIQYALPKPVATFRAREPPTGIGFPVIVPGE